MITVEKGRVVSQEVIDNFGGLTHRDNNHLETGSLREVRKRTRGAISCQVRQLSPHLKKSQI
ncbi:MAG: hypothetical protein MUP25_05840 [Syntrophales bacterium]|nr:hypothetical protein [Syntrophales bacterium]